MIIRVIKVQILTKDEASLIKSYTANIIARDADNPASAETKPDGSIYEISIIRDLPRITSDIRHLLEGLQNGKVTQAELDEKLSEYTQKYIKEDMPVGKKSQVINNIRILAKYANSRIAQYNIEQGLSGSEIAGNHRDAQNKIDGWAVKFANSLGISANSFSAVNFDFAALKNASSGNNAKYINPAVGKGVLIDLQL